MRIALSLAALPVHAQPLGPSWETYVAITQGDIEMIKTTLAAQIHGNRPGTSAAWVNPQSGNSGSIILIKVSSRDGRRCEQIEYRMIPPNKTTVDRFVLMSCVQADGSWKFSS
jgi:hypothetical protein